jgi:hypothetical protein
VDVLATALVAAKDPTTKLVVALQAAKSLDGIVAGALVAAARQMPRTPTTKIKSDFTNLLGTNQQPHSTKLEHKRKRREEGQEQAMPPSNKAKLHCC